MTIRTAVHVAFRPTGALREKHHDRSILASSHCVRIDDSAKKIFVGRGEASFAHKKCSEFRFDHIGISPEHNSTFLHVVAPMVYDFVESALPKSASGTHTPRKQGLSKLRHRTPSPPVHVDAVDSTTSRQDTFVTSNTVFVYGHHDSDQKELYRFLAEKIAETASHQVRVRNLALANEEQRRPSSGPLSDILLDLSFSLSDSFHTWGIADVLSSSSFLHDVNGMRTLNATKRSNGSKGLSFVMPTQKPLARIGTSVKSDVAEVRNSVALRDNLRILYRKVDLADHQKTASAMLTFFCTSSERTSLLHLVLLPEADSCSPSNRIASQLAAVGTTIHLLQRLRHAPSATPTSSSIEHSFHDDQSRSMQDEQADQNVRVPMRESPVLMYLMQTDDYYFQHHLVAFRKRLGQWVAGVDDSRSLSDASYLGKKGRGVAKGPATPHLNIDDSTTSASQQTALPSASVAKRSLGSIVLIVAINCSVDCYSHVLSACHFAARARRGAPLSIGTSEVSDSPSRQFRKTSGASALEFSDRLVPPREDSDSPLRDRHHSDYSAHLSVAQNITPAKRRHQEAAVSLSAGSPEGAAAAFGSNEPSMISYHNALVSQNASALLDGTDDESETSVERKFRDTQQLAASGDHVAESPKESHNKAAVMSVELSPFTPPPKGLSSSFTPISDAAVSRFTAVRTQLVYDHQREVVNHADYSRTAGDIATQTVGNEARSERAALVDASTDSLTPVEHIATGIQVYSPAWQADRVYTATRVSHTSAVQTDAQGATSFQVVAHATVSAVVTHDKGQQAEERTQAAPQQLCEAALEEETDSIARIADSMAAVHTMCDAAPPLLPGSMQSATNACDLMSSKSRASTDRDAFDFELPEMEDFMSRSHSAVQSRQSVSPQSHVGGFKAAPPLRDKIGSPNPVAPPAARPAAVLPLQQLAGGSPAGQHALLVEKLYSEQRDLAVHLAHTEEELRNSKQETHRLRVLLDDRDEHIKALSSKLEDLINHRQHQESERVASHATEDNFYKTQLQDSLKRHEATVKSLQETMLSLSREKLSLERELVQVRQEITLTSVHDSSLTEQYKEQCRTLQSVVDTMKNKLDQQRDELMKECLLWKSKADSSASEVADLRRSLTEHNRAAELRKAEETLRNQHILETKIREALSLQVAELDGERKQRLALEHEVFCLRLQVKDLTSRLVFFEEEVAPEVDLSIKELEEQMQKMRTNRIKFQRSLRDTLSRTSSNNNSPSSNLNGSAGDADLRRDAVSPPPRSRQLFNSE